MKQITLEDMVTEIIALNMKEPQLRHASNVIGKWHNIHKMSKNQKDALIDIIASYYTYLKGNYNLSGYSNDIIIKRTSLLNEYYNFYIENKYDNIFSSQGKFRPTILEEFMYFLFKDYVSELKRKFSDKDGVLDSGSAKAYTNLFFSAPDFEHFIKQPTIEINVKDQDFAIFRNLEISANGNSRMLKIPVIAIENKTYIDKTMLDGIIATADKIKTGNPYAMFIAVAENYDVDLSVDPAYSRIDQIYVLRKSKRKAALADIDSNVVIRLFTDVCSHISRPWSDVETKMTTEGIII